jgi:uncharacterized protein YjbI with pentapeptide repeats
MADDEQLRLIRRGRSEWNRWRTENPNVAPDLAGADLCGADLCEMELGAANLREANLSWAYIRTANLRGANLVNADLSEADLRGTDFTEANLSAANLRGQKLVRARFFGADLSDADLRGADLEEANLRAANLRGAYLEGANLCGAHLQEANLRDANLRKANLSEANFFRASLRKANLRESNLREANLREATLIGADLEHAVLTDAQVYGVSVWDVKLEHAVQTNLVINEELPNITVDNLEVAQFIYLLLNNSKLRDVIDTITSKVVLILGRFTPERKTTLDALRDALRSHDYLPILFDFEKPANRDFTETVSTLAHLARFVIADLTDPRSIPQELTAIVPQLLSVPIRPLLLGSQSEWSMFSDLLRYPQVITPLHYTDDAMLLSRLEADVIAPAEQRARALAGQ